MRSWSSEVTDHAPRRRIIPLQESPDLSEINETALIDPDAAAKPERRAFAEAEMITCDECLRANPPTRAACMYCSAELRPSMNEEPAQSTPSSAASRTDDGYYLVLAPTSLSAFPQSTLSEAASLLGLNVPELKNAI